MRTEGTAAAAAAAATAASDSHDEDESVEYRCAYERSWEAEDDAHLQLVLPAGQKKEGPPPPLTPVWRLAMARLLRRCAEEAEWDAADRATKATAGGGGGGSGAVSTSSSQRRRRCR
jgi:hypothetical protein